MSHRYASSHHSASWHQTDEIIFTPPSSPGTARALSESPDDRPPSLTPDRPAHDSAAEPQSTPASQAGPSSPSERRYRDRYIAYEMGTPDNLRVGMRPEKLSPGERLLRTNAISPDPFLRRLRLPPPPRRLDHIGPRPPPANGRLEFAIRQTNRVVSPEAIWNIGGVAPPAPGPTPAVHDGYGHIMASGTTAPMYLANFCRRETDQDARLRYESQVATALDLDRTSRMMTFTSQSKLSDEQEIALLRPKTRWQGGRWVNSQGIRQPRKDVSPTEAVPATPFRILEAANFRDDFYCSLLAYCSTENVLAVALESRVYLWSERGGVDDFEKGLRIDRHVHVTSLSFSSSRGGRSILAAGRSNGHLSLRSLRESDARFTIAHSHAIACVSFKPVPTVHEFATKRRTEEREELLVGDECGEVLYYSIRWDQHGRPGKSMVSMLAKICIHRQQICGLVWSPDGEFFATGGNDNQCHLFEVRDVLKKPEVPDKSFAPSTRVAGVVNHPDPLELTRPLPPRARYEQGASEQTMPGKCQSSETEVHRPPESMPPMLFSPSRAMYIPETKVLYLGPSRQKHTFHHTAAVKAIAFCPWQRSLLATGGGSNDRTIRFWHVQSGACLAAIVVHAQVTSLIWSTTRHEIAATFGYAQPEHPYRIAVFAWPSCRQVVGVPWSQPENRALFAIPYPGGPNDRAKSSNSKGEGGVWSTRTREEGSIIIGNSGGSINFHEIWPES